MAMGIGVVAVTYLLIGFAPLFLVVVVAMLFYGMALNYVNVGILSFFIQNVKEDYRGRVLSLLETFSFASVSLSYLLANTLSEALGTLDALVINGIALIILTISIVLIFIKQRK